MLPFTPSLLCLLFALLFFSITRLLLRLKTSLFWGYSWSHKEEGAGSNGCPSGKMVKQPLRGIKNKDENCSTSPGNLRTAVESELRDRK